MDAMRRDLLGFAILMGVMALVLWLDSMPAGRVPFGVAMIVLAILVWVMPVVRPRATGAPDLPLWNKISLSIGSALFGISKIWPSTILSTAAILCMFAPYIPQWIRSYR